jgi:hypothetical protein
MNMNKSRVKYNPEAKNFELILRAPDGSGISEVYALWQDYDYKIVSNLDSRAIYHKKRSKIEKYYRNEEAVLLFFEEVQKSYEAGTIPLDRYIPGIKEPFGPKLMCEAFNRALNTFGYFVITEQSDFLAYHILRTYSKGDIGGGYGHKDYFKFMKEFNENLKTEEMMNTYLDLYQEDLEIIHSSVKRFYYVQQVLDPGGRDENGNYHMAVYTEPLAFFFARPKLAIHNRPVRYLD